MIERGKIRDPEASTISVSDWFSSAIQSIFSQLFSILRFNAPLSEALVKPLVCFTGNQSSVAASVE
jgi:hypothetical protein